MASIRVHGHGIQPRQLPAASECLAEPPLSLYSCRCVPMHRLQKGRAPSPMQLCASCLSAARLTGCCTLLAAGSGRLHPSQLLRPQLLQPQHHPLQHQQLSLPQHCSLSLPLHPSSRHSQASHRVWVAFQCHPRSAGPVPGAPSADAFHNLPFQTLTLGVCRFWVNKHKAGDNRVLTSRVNGCMAQHVQCMFGVPQFL